MNLNHMTLFLFGLLILIISCDTGSDDSNQSDEHIISEYQLALADSFGVEIGDSIDMDSGRPQ